MKTILQETKAEVVGLSTRKHQDRFDEADKEIQELLEKKRSSHNHLPEKTDDKAAEVAHNTTCSTFQEGKRDRVAPRKRYKDQLKTLLAQAEISHQSWQQEALDRDSWCSSVKKASCKCEAERHEAQRKDQEAERASSIPVTLSPNLRESKAQ